jgi:predicted Zn-dependent protease
METRCGRRLEDALSHAKRGVELEPSNTAILDTLAETYFRQGDRAKAVEAMKKCAELEPRVQRHRIQIKRFQDAPLDSVPPPG